VADFRFSQGSNARVKGQAKSALEKEFRVMEIPVMGAIFSVAKVKGRHEGWSSRRYTKGRMEKDETSAPSSHNLAPSDGE